MQAYLEACLDVAHIWGHSSYITTVKPVLSGHSQKDQKWVFKTNYGLMQVKSIAECSKGSILQYFQPALSYHMALIPFYFIFLNGCLRQVSLYLMACFSGNSVGEYSSYPFSGSGKSSQNI